MFTATACSKGINIQKGDVFVSIMYGWILRILRTSYNDKVYLNDEKTLVHEYFFNYCSHEFEHKLMVTVYNETMILHLNRQEWNVILNLCGYPTLPQIDNDICTLCQQNVGTDKHDECAFNIPVKIFLLTNYGSTLTCCFITFLIELLDHDAREKYHWSDIDDYRLCRVNTALMIENVKRDDFYKFIAYDPVRPFFLKQDCLILNDDYYFNMFRLCIKTFLLDQLEYYYNTTRHLSNGPEIYC